MRYAGIPPARAAESDWHLFGDALACGIPAIGNATDPKFDSHFVDDVGVVLVEPFRGLGVIGVLRIGEGVEQLVETGPPTWRPSPNRRTVSSLVLF